MSCPARLNDPCRPLNDPTLRPLTLIPTNKIRALNDLTDKTPQGGPPLPR